MCLGPPICTVFSGFEISLFHEGHDGSKTACSSISIATPTHTHQQTFVLKTSLLLAPLRRRQLETLNPKLCTTSGTRKQQLKTLLMITGVVATLQVITRLQHRYQARGAKLGTMVESITQEAQLSRVRELARTLPNDRSWEQMWHEGVSPWNLRGVTPAITHLVKENELREGRYLVPGCGLGYDVVALASAKRHVVGLDISKTGLEKARELASGNPNAQFVEFVNADFFTYVPPAAAAFDAIFDYTFFCALDPSLRPEWAKKTAELLAVDGELITLVYPLGEYEGGPPYAVSLQAYEEVLHPWGLTVSSCNDDIPSVEARKGREKLVRWIRLAAKA